MKIRGLYRYILSMCASAWSILTGSLKVSCTMALCAFIILISIGSPNVHTYELYKTALSLSEVPAGLLLLASIFSACLDDIDNSR